MIPEGEVPPDAEEALQPETHPPLKREVKEGHQAVQPPPLNCLHSPRPVRITGRYNQGNGVGFRRSYTTLEAFFSPLGILHSRWMPFIDVRGHVFNDGRPAVNAGVGLRYLGSYVYGINTYYDYRKTRHQHYNQIGVGLETLGNFWGAHLNGYIPVGRKKSHGFGQSFSTPPGFFFQGHNLFIVSGGGTLRKKVEFAFYGVDAHAEFLLGKLHDVHFVSGAGPYAFWGKYDKKAIGGRGNLGVYWRNYASLGIQGSYDNLYHARGQVQVALTLPLGPKERASPEPLCGYPEYLSRNLTYGPDRFEMIVVDQKKLQSSSPLASAVAIDPVTGQPYIFWFVNNTSSSLGTFESPFNNLAAAQNASQANDVIYVYPGDGTTNGMAAGITLKDNQRLWGTGITQTLPTTMGTILIAPLASGMPQITNSATTVTAANNNEIAGINVIVASSTIGIDVNGFSIPNIHDVNIHDNLFTLSSLTSGTRINDVNGQCSVTHNTFAYVNVGASEGIHLSNMGTGSVNTVSNNVFSGVNTAQIGVTVASDPPNGVSTVTISNNQFSNLSGVAGAAINGIMIGQLTVTQNSFQHCQGTVGSQESVRLNSPVNAAMTCVFSQNTWTQSVAPNQRSFFARTDTGPASLCVTLVNNSSDATLTAYEFSQLTGTLQFFPSGNVGTITPDAATQIGSPCP